MDVKVTEALKQHYDTDRYGLRYVFMSLIISISYNHQCFYCLKTVEGVRYLIDPPTKAYTRIHLWLGLQNLEVLSNVWGRGYPEDPSNRLWYSCPSVSKNCTTSTAE
jgi:hypothetical protein